MSDTLSDSTMVCLSTGNQPINLIPSIQFGIHEVIIVSTAFTESNGLTKRLIEVMTKYGIKAKALVIDDKLEKNVPGLCDLLLTATKGISKVVWNISGGQKVPTIACYAAFSQRTSHEHSSDVMLYVEGNRPEIWRFGSDYQESHVTSNAQISLSNLMRLPGSDLTSSVEIFPTPDSATIDGLATGKIALLHYIKNDHFRSAFFNYMEPDDGCLRSRQEIVSLLKRSIPKVKLSDLEITCEGYKGFESTLGSLSAELVKSTGKDKISQIMKKLRLIHKPDLIFNDYWGSIKRAAINQVMSSLETRGRKLVGFIEGDDKKQLLEQITSIGGICHPTEDSKSLFKQEVRLFSRFGSNGTLFEWMVAASVIDCIKSNVRISEKISNVHVNCVLPDSELDLVITTRFGTLIILEMKTFKFTGDLARSKENTAYKRSGPYGKAIIVGPLLQDMFKKLDDGKCVYPAYIHGAVKDQEKTAKQSGIEYVTLDGLSDMLKRKLYV